MLRFSAAGIGYQFSYEFTFMATRLTASIVFRKEIVIMACLASRWRLFAVCDHRQSGFVYIFFAVAVTTPASFLHLHEIRIRKSLSPGFYQLRLFRATVRDTIMTSGAS